LGIRRTPTRVHGIGRLFDRNNLCFWQNRFGDANRDHRALLEAVSSPKSRGELEQLLFGLYRGKANEGATFDRLGELTGAKYPLLAYLYFLQDMDRFMPIQPTTFDRAFRGLGIELVTLRNCRITSALTPPWVASTETLPPRRVRLVRGGFSASTDHRSIQL
jgi:hypothetical protein